MADDEMTVSSLANDLPPAHPVREALETPYTLARWGEELRQLADGATTGFDALDDLGVRWLPGKLHAIIARPGGGKTAFLLEATLRYLDTNPDRTALVLSWEEPLADLFTRLVLRMDAALTRQGASFSGVPLFAGTVRAFGRDPDSTDSTFAHRIAAAAAALNPLLSRLRLVDGDAMGRDTRTVFREVAAWMRDEAESETGARVGLVAVDYFQKLRTRDPYTTRQTELQAVADTIRRFAKGATLAGEDDTAADAEDAQFAVPVLVGAQVNRSAVADEHPGGDQIREADDLLNDAAAVIALSWERTRDATPGDELRVLRVSVPKHRGGRARPEDVTRYTWHPARAWIAPGALRENGSGPITWTPLEALKSMKAAGGRGANGTTQPPRIANSSDYE